MKENKKDFADLVSEHSGYKLDQPTDHPVKSTPDYQHYPTKKEYVKQASFRVLSLTDVAQCEEDIFYQKYRWNENFQSLLEKPTSTAEEAVYRQNEILRLSQQLAEAAKPIVKTIIKEINVPVHLKTITPVESGGIAGGKKYIKDHMFFKFATDDSCDNIYGNDENAAKAAGHELKAMNVLISTGVRQLHIPLSCIINYRGYRLLVNALLPVNEGTLISGSRDAGKTIKTDTAVSHLLQQASAHLNLKTHPVQAQSGEIHQIHTAIDIECHRGLDGRYYLLDLARLMPPEAPVPGIDQYHLFRLLRAEFVRSYPHALSADAFARFGKMERDEHNQEVKDATDHLFTQTFSVLAEKLKQTYRTLFEEKRYSYSSARIKQLFHENGVNMRFLAEILRLLTGPVVSGAPITLIPAEPERKMSTSTEYTLFIPSTPNSSSPRPLELNFPVSSDYIAQLKGDIAAEIGARLFKSIINDEMREASSDVAITEAISEQIPWLIGDGSESEAYWRNLVLTKLHSKFIICLGRIPERKKELVSFIENADIELTIKAQKTNLLKRITSLTGIIFAEKYLKRVSEDPSAVKGDDPMDFSDIKEVATTEKHVQLFAFVEEEGEFGKAEKYYLDELATWKATLGGSHPQIARLLTQMAVMYANFPGKSDIAEQYYRDAVVIMSIKTENELELADINEQLSLFYISKTRFGDAESLLREVLRVKENKLGKDHIAIAVTRSSIAWACHNLRRLPDAFAHYEEGLKVLQAHQQGEKKCPDLLARLLNNMGLLLLEMGRMEQAENYVKQSLAILETHRGPWHSEVAIAKQNLGRFHAARSEFDVAKSLFETASDILKKAVGENHYQVACLYTHQAALCEQQNDPEGAERFYQAAFKIFPVKTPKSAQTLRHLAKFNVQRKEKEKAKEKLREALSIFRDTQGAESDNYQKTKRLLDTLNSDKLPPAPMSSLRLLDGFIDMNKAVIDKGQLSDAWKDVMRRLTDVSQTNLTSTHMMSAILEVTMKKETGAQAKKALINSITQLPSPGNLGSAPTSEEADTSTKKRAPSKSQPPKPITLPEGQPAEQAPATPPRRVRSPTMLPREASRTVRDGFSSFVKGARNLFNRLIKPSNGTVAPAPATKGTPSDAAVPEIIQSPRPKDIGEGSLKSSVNETSVDISTPAAGPYGNLTDSGISSGELSPLSESSSSTGGKWVLGDQGHRIYVVSGRNTGILRVSARKLNEGAEQYLDSFMIENGIASVDDELFNTKLPEIPNIDELSDAERDKLVTQLAEILKRFEDWDDAQTL